MKDINEDSEERVEKGRFSRVNAPVFNILIEKVKQPLVFQTIVAEFYIKDIPKI